MEYSCKHGKHTALFEEWSPCWNEIIKISINSGLSQANLYAISFIIIYRQ